MILSFIIAVCVVSFVHCWSCFGDWYVTMVWKMIGHGEKELPSVLVACLVSFFWSEPWPRHLGHGTGSYFKNGGGRSTTTILHPILAALCSLLLLFFLFPGLLFLEMLVGFQSSLTSPRRKISLHRLISYITYEYSAYPSCIGLLLRNTRKGGPQSVAPDVGIVFFPCLTRVRSPVLPAELI